MAVFLIFQPDQSVRQHADAVAIAQHYIFPAGCRICLYLKYISHHRILLLSLTLYCRRGDSCDKLFLEE